MINVFIGSEPKQIEAERTLISSLQRHHDPDDLNIVVMRNGDLGWDDWGNHGPTQFTLFRFAVPQLMNYSGWAIYLDCDMLVLDDIEDLLMCGRGGRWIKAAGTDGDCVSVIDCACVLDIPGWPVIDQMKQGSKRKWDIRPMLAPVLQDGVPVYWNQHDSVNPKTKLIHFTAIDTQPWILGNVHPSPEAVALWTKEWMSLKPSE